MAIERNEQLHVLLSASEKALLQWVAEEEGAGSMSAWVREWMYRRMVMLIQKRLGKRAREVQRETGAEEHTLAVLDELDEEDFVEVFDDVLGESLDGLDMDLLFDMLQEQGGIAKMIPTHGRDYTFRFLAELSDWLIDQQVKDMRVRGMKRFAQRSLAEVGFGEE
jgi:hypothetical protein